MLNRIKNYIQKTIRKHVEKELNRRMESFQAKLTQSYVMVSGYQALLKDDSKHHLLFPRVESDQVISEIARLEGIKKSLRTLLEDIKESDTYLIQLI